MDEERVVSVLMNLAGKPGLTIEQIIALGQASAYTIMQKAGINPTWNKPAERLPENNEKVLIVPAGLIKCMESAIYAYGRWYKYEAGGLQVPTPAWWRELPEAPE